MAYHCVKNNSKECDGCMDCSPYPHYYCPLCGEEVYETVFVNNDGDVIGCENCAEIKEPHEVLTDETDQQ
jgi:uncharacterized OB-fold protein